MCCAWAASPKTKRKGKPFRFSPLWPEIRQSLEELYAIAPEGKYIINRYRSSNANLRTQLERIITRAGVEPWPRLFQNLRATELLDKGYSLKNVADWLGHTERIDIEHYQSTTSEHVARASTDWTIEGGTGGGDKTIENDRKRLATVELPKRENPEKHAVSRVLATSKVGRAGLEPATKGL